MKIKHRNRNIRLTFSTELVFFTCSTSFLQTIITHKPEEKKQKCHKLDKCNPGCMQLKVWTHNFNHQRTVYFPLDLTFPFEGLYALLCQFKSVKQLHLHLCFLVHKSIVNQVPLLRTTEIWVCNKSVSCTFSSVCTEMRPDMQKFRNALSICTQLLKDSVAY